MYIKCSALHYPNGKTCDVHNSLISPVNMRRFGEDTSNKHNISVALDPHGNSAYMYLVSLLHKRFRLSASSEVYNQ